MSAATALQLRSPGKLSLSPHCCSAEQSAMPILAEPPLQSQKARPDKQTHPLSKLEEVIAGRSIYD